MKIAFLILLVTSVVVYFSGMFKRSTKEEKEQKEADDNFSPAYTDELYKSDYIEGYKMRGSDAWGSGYFGAPRGKGRTHKGIDLMNDAQNILLNFKFQILRYGKSYASSKGNDLCEIKILAKGDLQGYTAKLMHIVPSVLYPVGSIVSPNTVFAFMENMTAKYPGMSVHVHLELYNTNGQLVDPTPYILS